MGQNNITQVRNMCLQNPSRPTKLCVLSWWLEGPGAVIILHLGRNVSACPTPLGSWEFHWGRRPFNFGWVYFPSSDVHIHYQRVQNCCYLLLTWTSQVNIINQCGILWKRQMTEKSLWAKLWHRVGKLISHYLCVIFSYKVIWSHSIEQVSLWPECCPGTWDVLKW